MAFIKIGKLLLDLASVDLIDLFHETPLSNETVVRIQLKNRRDEVVMIGGRPTHIKHGVIELPVELSDKFRWFVSTFAPTLGLLDVDKAHENKEQIEAMQKQLVEQQAVAKAQVPVGVRK